MAIYITRRLLLLPVLLVGLSLITFVVSHKIPGNPLVAQLGLRGASNPQTVRTYRKKWGLDRSLPEQYVAYVGNLLHGDFGRSLVSQRPVSEDLKQYMPATIELAIASLFVAAVPGLLLGIWAAVRANTVTDSAIRLIALLGSSLPVFWLGLIVLFLLYGRLGWLPGPGRLSPYATPPPQVTGLYTVDSLLAGKPDLFWDALKHLVLPAFVLGWSTMGVITRMSRSSLLDVLNTDYVRTARAKGLTPLTVLRRHAVRNAIVPTLTVTSLAFGGLLAGAVLTEVVFSWPGIGQYAVQSADNLDVPGVMGVTLVAGLLYVLVNLLADILYALFDPRIRYA